MKSDLSSKLKSLPNKPGVYLFKGGTGEILYVGKAKILKHRVKSYFGSEKNLMPKTIQLVRRITDLDYIICDTETESLMLESNLINKYRPRFNILLRDDKNYQFIKIDYSTDIPNIYTVRKIDDKKSKFFGPYTSSAAVRSTLSLLRYIFPYCSNKKVGQRPCFYYHLSRCPGVCVGKVTLDEYKNSLGGIERFLRGEFQNLLKNLRYQMSQVSDLKQYEKAARIRDQINVLQKTLAQQKIIGTKRESFDTISIFPAGDLAAVNLFQVREGKLLGRLNFILENAATAEPQDLIKSFCEKYYAEASDIPQKIVFQEKIIWDSDFIKIVSKKINKKIVLLAPSRGRKRKLVRLGVTNARDYLEQTSINLAGERAKLTKAIFELQSKLHLKQIPLRMECFDISNIQGTSPVGSMVVFENGRPKKSDYKRFAIKSLDTPNDFAMMKEMLSRRFAHRANVEKSEIRNPKSETNHKPKTQNLKDESWRLPDLVIVDGGKGQLNIALNVLKEHGLKIPAMGLAKKNEDVYLPEIKLPLKLPSNSPALHLLQRIRDEAHRFAITYHRKKRSRRLFQKEF